MKSTKKAILHKKNSGVAPTQVQLIVEKLGQPPLQNPAVAALNTSKRSHNSSISNISDTSTIGPGSRDVTLRNRTISDSASSVAAGFCPNSTMPFDLTASSFSNSNFTNEKIKFESGVFMPFNFLPTTPTKSPVKLDKTKM